MGPESRFTLKKFPQVYKWSYILFTLSETFPLLCFQVFLYLGFVTNMGEIKISPDYNWFRSTVPLKKVGPVFNSCCPGPVLIWEEGWNI